VNIYRFSIIGTPEPKGSAKAMPTRHKFPFEVAGYGDLLRSVAVTSDNPKIKAWQNTIAAAARVAIGGEEPLRGAVGVELVFYIVPPKHIPKQREGLPIVRDDVDKLSRACLDAMSGVLFVDDAQVIDLLARKRYAETPARARVEITVTAIAVRLPLIAAEPEEPSHAHRPRRRRAATAAIATPW
jgi:crossover junction endodeoxyribonuclease RusA